MKDILVIIPCYNEEENIKGVVEELKRDFQNADILIVNDCSTDNTLSVLKTLDISYITMPFNVGYSGALQTGFKYAVRNNYKYVVQFDGDGQHIAKEAEKLYTALVENNADIVIGSRFIEKSDYKHGILKIIGTNIFSYLIMFFCKQRVYDPTSGFQILDLSVFERYARIHNYPEYPDANLIIEMMLLGYKIVEIPSKMRLRIFGTSMHSGFFKPVLYMIKMFYSILMILLNYSYSSIKKQKDE